MSDKTMHIGRRDLMLGAASLWAVAGLPSIALAAGKPSLTVAVGADPVNLDPHRVSGGNDYLFFGNVFEGLYGHDPAGKLVPALAESHTVDEAGRIYEFTLRKGASFHNGDPVTPADVIFSWKRGIAPETMNPRANVLLQNISSVEPAGSDKVRVVLKEIDAAFLENSDHYWYIMPEKYFNLVGLEGFLKAPVGTGPFSFVERRVKEYLKLRGFDKHWGRVPKVGEVTLRVVPDDQTRVAQLLSNESDIVVNIPPVLAARMKAPTLQIKSVPSFQNIFISINANAANTAMGNVEVRRALNMAIDREALLKSTMLNYASLQTIACSQGIQGCRADVKPYRYDKEAARKLLEQHKFDFDRPLRFIGLAPGRTPQSKEIVEGIGYMLQQVGVKTRIDILEYGAWLAMYGAGKNKDPSVDLIFSTFTDYNNDPSGRLRRTLSTGAAYAWYSTPELDKQLAEMNDFTSETEREKFISKIFTEVHEAAPFITLWAVDAIYGMSSKVQWEPTIGVSWPLLWNVSKSA